MNTNFVSLTPIKEDDTLESLDATIRLAAEKYIALQRAANEMKAEAEDRLFTGSPGTIYLKKRGHRKLSVEDISQLISAKGTDEDRAALAEFATAQTNLSERLQKADSIGLILKQAEIAYMNYYKRIGQPELWTPEQVIQIVDVLDRLRV